MNYEEDLFQSLKRILTEPELKKLGEMIIYKDEDGYQLFNTYTITKSNDMYMVSKIGTHTVCEFYTLRNAVAWATLEKRGLVRDADRVSDLDTELSSLDFSIKVHDRAIKKLKDQEARLLHIIKMKEDKIKKNQINIELNRYVHNTRTWQLRQFKNQIAK